MKRRSALKGMVFFIAGSTVLYSCKDKYEAIKSLNLAHLPLEDEQIQLLMDLSERIVPLNQIEALKNHITLPFVLTMVNDIYRKEKRKKFVKGYTELATLIQSRWDMPFGKLEDVQKDEFITEMMVGGEEMTENMSGVFHVLKSEGVKYLVSSEHVQRQVRYYEMAPNRYIGCVDVSELKNKNQPTNG